MTLDPAAAEARIPLTGSQRLWLAAGCLPVVFWAVVLALLATRLRWMLGPRGPWVIALAAAIVVYFARQAVHRIRDLRLGAALVAEDRMLRANAAGRGANGYAARFERLGTLRMRMGSVGINGHRYRVYYSPASRLAWKIEALRY